MKLLLLSFIALILPSHAPEKPVERLGIAGPLRFQQTAFNLAFSSHPTASFYLQEYLPKGETMDHFTRLLTVRVTNQNTDVKQLVNEKITELEARKKTDVMCNYQVMANDKSQEVIVDFIVSDKINDPQAIVEFSIYRYRQIALGATRRAVLIYAYSQRSYGSAVNAYLKALPQTRRAALDALAKTPLPVVKINGK